MITKRPTAPAPASPAAIEKFISGAPDAGKGSKAGEKGGLMRGNRLQISHTLPPALLASVDSLAASSGMTRAGIINLGISELIERKRA